MESTIFENNLRNFFYYLNYVREKLWEGSGVFLDKFDRLSRSLERKFVFKLSVISVVHLFLFLILSKFQNLILIFDVNSKRKLGHLCRTLLMYKTGEKKLEDKKWA